MNSVHELIAVFLQRGTCIESICLRKENQRYFCQDAYFRSPPSSGVQWAWHGPLVSSCLDNRGRWWHTALVDSYQDAGCYGTQQGSVLDNRRRWGRHWSGALRKSCHPHATRSLMMHSTMCLLHSTSVYQPVYSSRVSIVTGYCCFSALSHWYTAHPGCLKASMLKS